MNARTPGLGDTSGHEIRTKGRIGGRWSDWFDEGVSLVHEADGTTVIRCPALDQAALHGLLASISATP